MVKGATRILPFERVALVLQGGGALGAYQAGVYHALHEANIGVDWLCGTSIGAINGAIIAGNPPEKRVERLRDFWETITKPPVRIPSMPWFTDLPWSGSPEAVSYYDIAPLKETLARLVDFDLINDESMRFTVLATNVRSGARAYFENREQAIGPAHILASASLPPSFPPTEIDGEYFWDGGVISNSPMQFVVDNRGRHTALVFQVDLWDENGKVPLDIPSANLRALEIHSASRINVSLEEYKRRQKFRMALHRFLDELPEQCRSDPDVQFLSEQARGKVATIVQLKYQSKKFETAGKMFEFSRRAMEEHWQAGYDDTGKALGEPAVFELPDVTEAARIFDVHRGWMD
jgi:NTE family protein